MITRLDHVLLAMPPGAEEQARAFYTDVLGLQEVDKPEPLASRGGCWFEGPGTVVHLGVQRDFTPARKAHAAFTVADLPTLRAALEAGGYPVIDDDATDTDRLYTADPFGNRLEFIQDGQGFSQRTAPQPAPGLGEIGQIAVPVTDLGRAVTFYREALGLEFLFQAPPGLGFFNCAGVRLMLDASGESAEHRSSVIYYRVPDIQAAYETFAARGVIFSGKPHLVAKMPDHELWMAFFHDPDRNLLALMSEVR